MEYTFDPQPKSREIYDYLYQAYKEFYPDLKGTYKKNNKGRSD